MADHCELVIQRPAAVNIAVATTHRAFDRADTSARHPAVVRQSGTTSLVSNQWSKDVAPSALNIPHAALTAS
jgi:hypothetical protein